MKRIIVSTFLVAVVSMLANAQEAVKKSYFQKNNFADASFSLGQNEGAGAISIFHNHTVGKKGRFKIGYGLRLTSYSGQNKKYTTAPATLTSDQQGPQVLFSKTYEENIDTVTFSKPSTSCLNLMINLEYNVYKKFDVGFNIDAIGFSFGGKKKGELHSNLQPASGLSVEQEAKPTPYNLLLVSDNDIGSLNSEFYVRYRFHPRVGVKAGYTFLFSEYKTDQKLLFDNDRFRQKIGIFMVGLTFALNHN